ncbi:hypothetical protein RND81_01G013600 [Saponaria officinalis]|uniref:F-box domain-containing protein n=1 Tax=Saponaria officinalis TaxID=3572 RepID=A0AAW1N551_SAPOF
MALRKRKTATATTTTATGSHRYPTRWKNKRYALFDVPREIIFNILLLIPAKLLHDVVRYVCKQWFDIVSDPVFVRVHRQMSSAGFLIQNPVERSKIYYIQEDTARLKVTEYQIPLHARINGSLNGLLLLHDMTNTDLYHVVNPITKKNFSLPPLTGFGYDNTCSKAGFGVDSSGLCKVVHASPTPTACCDEVLINMRVFTVGVDLSWRFIDFKGISLSKREKYALRCSSLFIAGFIYWYNMPYCNGVALDVDTETVYKFSFPAGLSRHERPYLEFLTTETCLGVVWTEGDIWRFWKLKDVKTSDWTELNGISIGPVLSRVDKMFYPRNMYFCLPVRLINGDFWFCRRVDKEYVVIRYNLVSDNFSFSPMTKVYCDTLIHPHVHTLIHPHVHTLISPKNC